MLELEQERHTKHPTRFSRSVTPAWCARCSFSRQIYDVSEVGSAAEGRTAGYKNSPSYMKPEGSLPIIKGPPLDLYVHALVSRVVLHSRFDKNCIYNYISKFFPLGERPNFTCTCENKPASFLRSGVKWTEHKVDPLAPSAGSSCTYTPPKRSARCGAVKLWDNSTVIFTLPSAVIRMHRV
jgi:hypothetical protein